MAERRAQGFTLIELVVVIAIVGVLVAVAAQRLVHLRAEAEQAAFVEVVGGLQAAITMEVLTRLTEGDDLRIAALADGNPMEWLLDPPRTYEGIRRGGDPAALAPGHWWFDASLGALVYRVRYPDRFRGGPSGVARARLRVRLVIDDRDGNGRFDPGVDGVGGARLEAVEAFAWERRSREA